MPTAHALIERSGADVDAGKAQDDSSEATASKDNPSGSSLISCDAAQQLVVTTITVDAPARHRADELDAEAAYDRRRAIQEQQVLGPGYYVDLLRATATDRAEMAQRIRTGKDATRSAPRQSG